MKRALSRLGYYMPPEIGITTIPDRGVFTALKEFQTDHALRPTGGWRADLVHFLKMPCLCK